LASAAKMRRGNRLLTLGLVLSDIVLINAAFLLAYFMRYELEWGGKVEDFSYAPVRAYLPVGLVLTVILLAVFGFEGLYRRPRGVSWFNQVYDLFSGTTIGIAILVVLYFGLRPYYFSRLMFAYSWLLITVFLGFSRSVVGFVQAHLRKRGIGVERCLIVGAGRVGRTIMQNLVAQPELGYQVIGFLDDDPQKRIDIGRFKALGATAEVARILETEEVDDVIITLPWMSHRKILAIMDQCQKQGVRFRFVPDLLQMSLSQVDIDEINGIPLIGIREVSIRGTSLLVKRAIDVTASAFGLLFLSPLILLVAMAIRLESRGPVLFRQRRVGKDGRAFTCYKFRSMWHGAEEQAEQLTDFNETRGITFKMRNDPRLTRVGRVIRRTSIDELPQLYNILRGEMSLVGPRPPLPSEVERYEDWHRKRLEVAPGLTCLWQVMGRSLLPFDEMVMLDIYYIENWSLGLDFRILLRTIPTVIFGTGAY